MMARFSRFSAASIFLFGIFVDMMLYSLTQSAFDNQKYCDGNDDYDRYPKSRSVSENPIYTSSTTYLRYINEYSTKMEGWFLYAIWVFSQYQYDHLNLFGGIGEIGVHHGELTCYLYLLRRYQEQNLFAVDIFDNQTLNKQKGLFLKHIREYSQVFENELAIYVGSSLDLNPVFSTDKKAISWWQSQVVGERGLQLVSVSFS